MWNNLLEMRDKKTREVTKEWSIQSNATRNRCFTPDFPISGGKHFWKEIIQHYVKTVASFTTSNTAQLNSYEECQTSWNCSIIFVMAFLFRQYAARFLMLCSPQSHVSAADHATSSEVHTRNISSDKKPGVVRPKTLPEA